MNTRIRYVKTEVPGEFVSMRTFVASDGTELRVHLNTNNNTFVVTAASSGQVLAEGSGASPANTKLKAKKAMAKLGASFGEETRNKVAVSGESSI